MRVLLVNWQDRLNPQAGGAETHLHEIFGRLAAREHQVTLLASAWRGAPLREWVDGLDVHRIGSRYTFGVVAPRYFRDQLAARQWDVLVEALNKVPVYSPVWAASPTVLLVHHLFGTTAFREAAAPLAAATWLLERPLRRVYRGVPVEAISHSTANDLVARGLRRADVRVIYPGVDVRFYQPDPAIRATDPLFVYLGRLKRYKGVDLIVRAVARLRDRGTRVRLAVAGRGEWEAPLRELAQRLQIGAQVEFCGFVGETEKRDLFRRAWAHVFTSPKEGWGITNLEAAACGTPSVASDAPGLRESVVHERTGTLVPHGNVAALADALHALATRRERVEELGREARRFAESFTWDRAADETEEHLRGVAERATVPPVRVAR